jgi:hypothetical protein
MRDGPPPSGPVMSKHTGGTPAPPPMKKYELNVFDDAGGEHLATVLIYGATDAEIDDKLEQLTNQLCSLDDAMDEEQAFAELDTCSGEEMPAIEDFAEDDGDEEDAEACPAGE